MGEFSDKFSMGPKIVCGVKWWHGPPLSSCKIWWKSNNARRYCLYSRTDFYRMPRKTVKFIPMVPKAHGRDNICVHRKSIKPWNFQKCFGAFYSGWFVVVHPCSIFPLLRQMAPLQSIKFQTARIFRFFCARITVIFWAPCICRPMDFFLLW